MDYYSIPEGADIQTVEEYLIAFLNEKDKLAAEHSLIFALEQLSIIAEQYAYYQIDKELEMSVTDYLIGVVDFSDFELMDIILFIVVNMSLRRVMDYLLNSKQEKSHEVMGIINESAEEMSLL